MTEEARTAALWRLFDALLMRLLAGIEGDQPAKASLLNVARAFLLANQITANARPDLRRGLQAVADARGLPFNKKDPTSH